MKTILLPTDFSKNSINAIDYAMELFKDDECDFYVLNVQKVSSFISDDMMVVSASATIYNTIIDAAKKSISNIITKIEKSYKNDKHNFHSIVDYDNIIDSINQACEVYKVDLIVMGTKGASGLEKVLFGSNTVHVMQRCAIPVLAIPNNCKFTAIDKITFIPNNLPLFNISDLNILKEIMQIFHSKLDILHISDENHLSHNININNDFFSTYFSDASQEFIDSKNSDIFRNTHKYLRDNNIKLLAMTSKRHSFFERLFTKHPVESFAFNIDIPFLVMRPSDLG